MEGVSEKDREEPITEWREDEKGRSLLKERRALSLTRGGTASSTVGGSLERPPAPLDEEMEGKACVCFHMQQAPNVYDYSKKN